MKSLRCLSEKQTIGSQQQTELDDLSVEISGKKKIFFMTPPPRMRYQVKYWISRMLQLAASAVRRFAVQLAGTQASVKEAIHKT